MTNEQIIFDRAVSRLIKQGEPSISEHGAGNCLYRGPNETACAIGLCIADEHYSNDFELDTPVNHDIVEAVMKSNPDLDQTKWLDEAFLAEIQTCHDDASLDGREGAKFIAEFKRLARQLADRQDLEWKHG